MVYIPDERVKKDLEAQPNWALSMAAAIPSGIIRTFEGAATFGAALLDLGVDKQNL